MKRPLAGALLAAAAVSLSALGAVGAAQAETVQPGNVTVSQTGTNQLTVTCPHPDDTSLSIVAQINFLSLAEVGSSYTEAADIASIDAFATDAHSADATLVNSSDTVQSIEAKLYSNVTDAITKPAVIYDETVYNGPTHKFHFNVNRKHVSYGTLIAHWSKAGSSQGDEVLACSYPNNSNGKGAPTTGPNFG
jgi:hypothetical protein